ncbi:CehA/McbA family metallohydrolase [Bacillus sp. FJAT-42315]|uniref:CehA/McbA family metallohydrolase n=1 Tax=Bacillus sp. FJAT-42315 TaxID=2014077 RepID=UPI000C238818|nr:CehA/McbA family metallohydrolase [Bacillus sp. FJAT-42315]
MEKLLTLSRFIAKEEERTYIEVPFHMEENTSRFLVKYEVVSQGEQSCVIDLGVKDPRRVRGWSGGARKEFYIDLHHATPGYVAGEFPKGEWAVLLGAYHVAEEGCIVNITISFEKQTPFKKQWLKGDLHIHSVHSDGVFTVEENAQIAKGSGLDFLGSMDHNTISQNFEAERIDQVLFIPGMELTTYNGHCNLFGANEPITDFRATTLEEINERLKEARENGCKISINHPFDEYCPWEYGFDVDFDWVEVWNGPWRESNERAVYWWHNQLVLGKRLTAVGGSDTHRPDPYVKLGAPTTHVYASKPKESILEAIEKGHVYLSFAPQGPEIDLTCGQAMVGDVASTNTELSLIVKGVETGDVVKIISNKGNEQGFQIQQETETFKHCWQHEEERTFYRVEVWREFPVVNKKLMAAMSNPIYFNVEME